MSVNSKGPFLADVRRGVCPAQRRGAGLDGVRDGADHEDSLLRQLQPGPGAQGGEGEARPQAGRHPLLCQGAVRAL